MVASIANIVRNIANPPTNPAVAPTFVRRSKVTEVNPLTLMSLVRAPPPFF